MRKQDLKDGMILEIRSGERFLIINDKMIGFGGYGKVSDYHDDLTSKYFNSTDIVKVYIQRKIFTLEDIFKDENLSLLWERKEIKLTDKEIEVLKALRTIGYEWLARDKNGALYTYFNKPIKKHFDMWADGDEYFFPIKNNALTLDFIQWTDVEPTKIDDLLNKMVFA